MGEGEFTYTMYFFSNRGQIWETIFLSKIPSASFVIPARTEPIRKEEKGRGGEGRGGGGIIKETILIRLVFYYSTKRKLFLTYVYICISNKFYINIYHIFSLKICTS